MRYVLRRLRRFHWFHWFRWFYWFVGTSETNETEVRDREMLATHYVGFARFIVFAVLLGSLETNPVKPAKRS